MKSQLVCSSQRFAPVSCTHLHLHSPCVYRRSIWSNKKQTCWMHVFGLYCPLVSTIFCAYRAVCRDSCFRTLYDFICIKNWTNFSLQRIANEHFIGNECDLSLDLFFFFFLSSPHSTFFPFILSFFLPFSLSLSPYLSLSLFFLSPYIRPSVHRPSLHRFSKNLCRAVFRSVLKCEKSTIIFPESVLKWNVSQSFFEWTHSLLGFNVWIHHTQLIRAWNNFADCGALTNVANLNCYTIAALYLSALFHLATEND